jgi:predicted flap endonuclease-1-like 5' DNA nuclease
MHSLGVIPGIGIAVEDPLCRAGVKSCNQLVDTSPSEIGEMLGYLAQGSDIERWIEQAGELIREHAY